MQVPCRYPERCHRCACALQVSWAVSRVCKYPKQCQGMQVPSRYPEQCQGYAGALQVSWAVSRVRKYHAGTLSSVRVMEAPCRYAEQCHKCAGTLQISWAVSCSRPNYTGGPTLFNVGIRHQINQWRYYKQAWPMGGSDTTQQSIKTDVTKQSTKLQLRPTHSS